MSGHTKGPWKTAERYLDCLSVVDSGGFEHVTAESHAILLGYTEILGVDHWSGVEGTARDISPEEQFANARLISSAPDLLEALRTIARMASSTKLRAVALAAIAKAEGPDQQSAT